MKCSQRGKEGGEENGEEKGAKGRKGKGEDTKEKEMGGAQSR